MRLKKTGKRLFAFLLFIFVLSGSNGFTAIVSATDLDQVNLEGSVVSGVYTGGVEGNQTAGQGQATEQGQTIYQSQNNQTWVQSQISGQSQITAQSQRDQASSQSQISGQGQTDQTSSQSQITGQSETDQANSQSQITGQNQTDQTNSQSQISGQGQTDQTSSQSQITGQSQTDQTADQTADQDQTMDQNTDQTQESEEDQSQSSDQTTANDQNDQQTSTGSDSQSTEEKNDDVSAASAEETLSESESLPELTQSQSLSGRNLFFSQDTEKGTYLSSDTIPQNVRIRGKKSSIKVYWDYPVNLTDIDGYIVLRKKGSSKKYKQIALVDKSKTSYKDSKNLKKNSFYSYVLVSYKKNTGLTLSEKTTTWAGGVITKSKKTNVYSAKISNISKLSSINKGSSLLLKASFSKKAAYKSVRWSSSNPSVISISSKGKVKAKAAGTAVITAKFASGYSKSYKAASITGGTSAAIMNVLKSWLGYSEKNGKHKEIIDIYNAYGNLPLNYAVTYRDAWCDTCLSAAAILSGNVNSIGRECGVRRHVDIFKKKKIWIENGKITPKPGYIVVYSWGKSTQPNNSGANHIGLVISVKKGVVTTIEGNYDDKVKKRKFPVGWGYVRGYAKPKYK